MALLAPAMQAGKAYYSRCEVQSTGADISDHLFLGVTCDQIPPAHVSSKKMLVATNWLGPGRGLSAIQRSKIPRWSGWQEMEQYLFKACLLTYSLCAVVSHSRCFDSP